MKICPKCLRQYESGNFCENCENEDGSPVKLEEEQVCCPKCGLKYKKGTKFCSECGTRLDGTGTSNAAGAAGLSMGDKNVIAGDVIGHKEETHIAGNATIIKNEDQTKQVKKCHICGSIVQIVDGFDCPECHQFTCASCFDSDAGCCTDCVEALHKRNEEEFKSALKMAYADGRIEYSERQQLITLQHKLKISDEKAKLFEQQLKGDNSEILTTVEELNIDRTYNLYYKEENAVKAFEIIQPIFNNHQNNEKILNIYIPLLAETDDEEALNFINSMQVDILMAYITAIDIALQNDDLDEAERKYKQAARIWPENALVKCYQVLLNSALYKKFKHQNFLDKAKELVENLGEAQNELELSMQVRVQMFIQEISGETVPEITRQFCKDNQLYYGIMQKQFIAKKEKERKEHEAQEAAALQKRNEEEYKNALKKAYSDGRIEFSKRQHLLSLQQELKLSDEKANLLKQQYLEEQHRIEKEQRRFEEEKQEFLKRHEENVRKLIKQAEVGDKATVVCGSGKFARCFTFPIKAIGQKNITIEYTEENTPNGTTGERYPSIYKILSIKKKNGKIINGTDFSDYKKY